MKKLCTCLLMYGAIISLQLIANQDKVLTQPEDQTDVYGIPTDLSEFEETNQPVQGTGPQEKNTSQKSDTKN